MIIESDIISFTENRGTALNIILDSFCDCGFDCRKHRFYIIAVSNSKAIHGKAA